MVTFNKVFKNILKKKIKRILILITLLLNTTCSNENPIKSENQSPIILLLSVSPNLIYTQDSAIVLCNAFDPDGDTLVYDWITDGRLKIKEGQGDGHFLYNTYENSRTVYSKSLSNRPDVDTVWVQVFARDRKGKSDFEIVRFIVKKN